MVRSAERQSNGRCDECLLECRDAAGIGIDNDVPPAYVSVDRIMITIRFILVQPNETMIHEMITETGGKNEFSGTKHRIAPAKRTFRICAGGLLI